MKCIANSRMLLAVFATTLVASALTTARAAGMKVENGIVYVHPTLKGAEGAGWVPTGSPRAARSETQRRESVAGFRMETDAQGRQWIYVHPTLKGAEGAGWVRKQVGDLK